MSTETELAPFPVDPTLQGIAIAWSNPTQSLIADRIMPRTQVGTKRFKYLDFSSEQFYTLPDTRVGRKATPNNVELFGEEKLAQTTDYGLDDLVPVDDIQQAAQTHSGYDPLNRATEFLSELLMLDREIRVAGKVFNAKNYATENVIPVAEAARWEKKAANPLAALLDALDKPLIRPNTAVMGRDCWSTLRQHHSLTGGGKTYLPLTRQQFLDMLELETLLIGDSFVNRSRKGQKVQFERTWSKHVALLHINPAVTSETGVSWGYTACFGERFAGRIETPTIGARGSVIVRVVESCAEIVSAPHAGVLLQNAIS